MKNFIRFLVVVLLMVSYTSCDEIDKLTEVDFNTTLNEQLVITVPAGTDLVLNKTMLVNIVNSDTEDYLDLLQSVKITSFTYQLINFSGDDKGTITGSFVADGVELFNHDMVVKQAVDDGTVFKITNTTLLNSIASKLKSGKNILIGLDGTSSGNGMNFTIKVTIKLAVTADVL